MINRKSDKLLFSVGTMLMALAMPVEAQKAISINSNETARKEFQCPKKITSHPCGGTLNDLTVSRPNPQYPEEAKVAGAIGVVTVCVQVDEEGKIYSAAACKGHPLLRQAAVDAAYLARLRPVYVAGKPIRFVGNLIYYLTLRDMVGEIRSKV